MSQAHHKKQEFIPKAALVPFPSLSRSEARPKNKKEHLTTVVTNLRQHHAIVRKNLYKIARHRRKSLTKHAGRPRIAKQVDSYPENSFLISCLETGHKDGSGNPAVKPSAYTHKPLPSLPRSSGTGSGNSGNQPETTTVPTPVAVEYANDLIATAETYGHHAAARTAQFQSALDRSSISVGGDGQEGSGVARSARSQRKKVRSVGPLAIGLEFGRDLPFIDRSRDPRLKL